MARDPRTPVLGQAAVELVVLLPLVAVIAAGTLQLALAGHAAWAVQQAAEAAARADAVGLDARAAARATLPSHLERGLRLRSEDDGGVQVRLRVPSVLRPLGVGDVTAHSRFPSQR